MNVKGFILEDDQRREFVMVCERSSNGLGRIFSLRGWQRRRLVPLQETEWECRQIAGGALTALHDLLKRLPLLIEHIDAASPDAVHPVPPVLGLRKRRRPNCPQ